MLPPPPPPSPVCHALPKTGIKIRFKCVHCASIGLASCENPQQAHSLLVKWVCMPWCPRLPHPPLWAARWGVHGVVLPHCNHHWGHLVHCYGLGHALEPYTSPLFGHDSHHVATGPAHKKKYIWCEPTHHQSNSHQFSKKIKKS